ncbi:MAG: S9 family peptidase, partial [Halobacteriales archaeon]
MEPPSTPRRDATYELHGDEIEDPYMWLEAGDDEAVGEWVDAQNEYADAVLAESDAREALRPRLAELARTVEYEPIKPTDSGFFQRVRHPEDDHAVLTYRESLGDERRALLDPNEWSDDGSVSMNWYAPSPDGTYVAYGVDEGGRENYDVHVLDVASGEDVEVLESMGRANLLQGAWKGEGFYYVTTGGADAGDQLDKEFRYHALGTDSDADLVVREEFAEEVWPLAVADEDGDHVVVALGTWDRADLYVLDHAGVLAAHDGGGAVELTPLIEGEDAKFDPEVAGDDLYVRTTHGAPNYRVARLDLGGGPPAGGADALETVVPEDDDAIVEAITVTDSRLFVQRNRDVVAELAVHDRDGSRLADVDLPGTGSLSEPQAHGDADALFVTYQSFDHPASACRVDAGGTGDETTGGTGGSDRSLDPSFEVIDRPDVSVRADLAVDQEWFESADGTEVPMFVVRRTDVERAGSNPAVLYGYGGFDISLGPEFRQYAVPFLEDGGVF